MERFDPVACINGLLQEVEQLKRDDMYRRGWGDAVATVMAALEDGRGEPVGVPYAALEGSEGGEDGW